MKTILILGLFAVLLFGCANKPVENPPANQPQVPQQPVQNCAQVLPAACEPEQTQIIALSECKSEVGSLQAQLEQAKAASQQAICPIQTEISEETIQKRAEGLCANELFWAEENLRQCQADSNLKNETLKNLSG